MNNVVLVGRITADLELKTTKSNQQWVRFSLAINSGVDEVDFIDIVAFDHLATNLAKYNKKGSLIGVAGRIKTGKYQHDKGHTVYTFDVIAGQIKYLDSKSKEEDNEELPF